MAQPVGVTTIPRTFGVLSIVFASIVLLGSLFGLLGLLVPMLISHAPPPVRPDDAKAMELISTMYLGMGVISAILTVMSALLLAVGVGQLRYRKWAAIWSPRWGVVALGALIVMAILLTTTMRSTFGDIVSAGSNGAPAAGRQVGTAIGGVYAAMMVLFYAPYPILMLVYFSRDRVRAAMTA
ncbi:MAG TPA: hypothetical protein VGL86_11370 [Polyangia bacterium]|jgi:hypothetical protein